MGVVNNYTKWAGLVANDFKEYICAFYCILDICCYGNKCPSPLIIADTSTSRREAVRKKTSEYLQYTEVLQDKLHSKQAVCYTMIII